MAVKVRERKGAWWLFIDFKGRRVARRVGVGKAGKRSAEAVAEQITAKLALGDLSVLDPPPSVEPILTFRAYAERWLEGHVRLRCKPSSYDRYAHTLRRHWFPVLGDLPLPLVTRERIKAALATLAGTLQARTLRVSTLVPLQGCLSAAVEDGLLPGNPAARLGRLIRADVLPQQDAFTRDELAGLLAVAEAEIPEHYPAVLTLARTGMRFGELVALQPGDLDFRERAILVRRNAYKGRVGTPKNGKGRRVDMSRQLAQVLQGFLSVREAEAVVDGRSPAPWLFPGPDGRPMAWGWFDRHVWRPLLRRADLRHRSPHQLRHTFASLLIQQGESLATSGISSGTTRSSSRWTPTAT